MYRFSLSLAGLLFCQFAYAAAGDIDEYDVRQKIRQHNPGISKRAENIIFSRHKSSSDFHAIDTNFNGKLSEEESDAFFKKSASYQRALAAAESGRNPPPSKPTEGGPANDRKAGEPDRSTTFILRRSFDEITALELPGKLKDATGAQLSYSRDNIARNTVWEAHGVAAIAFSTKYSDLTESQRFTPRTNYTVAPYIKFDRVSNSNPDQSSKSLGTLTPGVILEVARENVSLTGQDSTTHYFRLDGGSTMDFQGVQEAWHIAGEWQPVSNDYSLNAPFRFHPFNIAFNSIFKIRAEYDSQIHREDLPIFLNHRYAFRVGPTVGLKMTPVTLGDFWPDWFKRVSVLTTYNVLQDLYSPATYSTFETAATYNIDEDGRFGLTASYRRGRVLETGEKLDVVMVGLSSKLGGE